MKIWAEDVPLLHTLALTVIVALLTACAGGAADSATQRVQEGDMVSDLYVNSQLVDCEGVAPQKCLQVRRSPEEDWELFYGQIEGFEFEPGYTYRLRVDVTREEDVPADASSLRYTLVEVAEKNPA